LFFSVDVVIFAQLAMSSLYVAFVITFG